MTVIIIRFAFVTRKCRRLLESTTMDERVGVTMHKLQFGALLAIDFGLHDFQAGGSCQPFRTGIEPVARRAAKRLYQCEVWRK
jgi:hypothetical protein